MKKSIIINQPFHKELSKLSIAFNLPLGRLVEEMISYFKRTGINPKNAINENPSVMVKALDKRIISFMKVQERDILKPIRSDVFEYQKTVVESFDAIVETLKDNNDNGNVKKANSFMYSELKKHQQLLVEIAMILDAKNKSGLHDKIKNIFS